MIRGWLRRVGVALLCAGVAFIIGLPFGLYGLGLSNIEGRPEAPLTTNDPGADTAVLQEEFRSEEPIAVHVLDPWTFVLSLSANKSLDTDGGSRAVWARVRNYNYSHLKNRKMSWWHLSGAALTFWVTRNSTTDEIITAAAAVVRSYPYAAR
jgi:hypothetical protein